jgi:hypothetical protein
MTSAVDMERNAQPLNRVATQQLQPRSWTRGDWLLACALGLGADGMIASEITRRADSMTSLTAFALVGLLQGAVLALCQARVLRRRLPRLTTYAWVAATALAASSIWAIGGLARRPLSAYLQNYPNLQLTIVAVLGLTLIAGALMGAVVGLAQSFALRRHTRNHLPFIKVNVLGWVAAAPFLGSAIAIAQLERGWWSGLGFGLACGVLAGVPLGSATCVFLSALEPWIDDQR